MRSYDEISADAIDERPFSNGTIGYGWMGEWCDRCAVDRPFQRDEADEGCPLLLVALLGKTPKEWTDQGVQDYDCTEFIDDGGPDDGGNGGPEPTPRPVQVVELPDQIDIFAEFADQIAEAPQREPVNA